MTPRPVGPDHHQSITRSEEQLAISTRRRATETIRITKRVLTENRTIVVPLRREELVIERWDAQASPTPKPPTGAGQTVPSVFILFEEEVVLETRIVAKERVRVSVETVTETRTIFDTVRKERLDTETFSLKSTDTPTQDQEVYEV